MAGQGTGDRGQGLELPQSVQDDMLQDCRRRHPKEACGFLIASAAGVICRAYPMTNVENTSIGYSMDPKEQLRVEKELRQRQERVVGIYHSHVASPAVPSPVDIQQAISPDVSYIVVSTMNAAQPDVKSYRIDGTMVTPEEIRLV